MPQNKLVEGFLSKASEAANFVTQEVNQFINNDNQYAELAGTGM